MKKNKFILTLALTLGILHSVYGQDSLWQRTYDFGIYNNYDLRNSSTNMISTYRILNDGFNEVIAAKMKPKLGGVFKGIFNFSTAYLTMLWSHEFGHSLRAKQVGGKFSIHNINLPVPYTTMYLPDNISLLDEALSVTAGFEVNYLNIRNLQSQFIRQNGLWNEDLALSFANRLMYPIYTTLVLPIDPNDKNVWIETAGDPVQYILPVFKNYSNYQVFMPDGSVNSDLASFYNQSTMLATFFQLLDPQFYREVSAAFGKSSKTRRPIFLIGNYDNGWTYGTLFNASPLGYELYFNHYIHLKGNQYGLYLKYGRPFKNIGAGFSMNNVIHFTKFYTDIRVEYWQQDLFGNGFSAESVSQWKISNKLGLNFTAGYKNEGYVLGKQINKGLNLGIGLSYFRN